MDFHIPLNNIYSIINKKHRQLTLNQIFPHRDGSKSFVCYHFLTNNHIKFKMNFNISVSFKSNKNVGN